MEKRFQPISTKSFDCKLPLIKHSNCFSFSHLTPLKKKSVFDHPHRVRVGFNFSGSSLSITGLTELLKGPTKKNQKKNHNFIKHHQKLKQYPQVFTDFSQDFEEDLRGWEVS